MTPHDKKPERILNGFLKELGEPVPTPTDMAPVGERVLQRLQASTGKALPTSLPSAVRGGTRWTFIVAGAAGLVTVAVLLAFLFRDGLQRGDSLRQLQVGEIAQANGGMNLHLSLEDGSRLEMREESQLSLERADDGLRIRLDRGSVIVHAAEQFKGHLYVQTRDCIVSVVGTVFLVKTETIGSRIAVIEGAVHVNRGRELKKLLPGEQVATSPQMTPVTVIEEVSWSQEAPVLVAMLQRGAAQTASPPPSNGLTGAVRGVVVREGTTDPIPGVQLTLAADFGPGGASSFGRGPTLAASAPLRATSDALGRFIFENAPVGQLVLGARREGYFGTPINGLAPSSVTRTVGVAFQQSTEVRIAMVAGSALVGKVFGPDHLPVSGANVEVLHLGYENGGRVVQTAGMKQTDAHGEYRLQQLPPGDYYLAASPRPSPIPNGANTNATVPPRQSPVRTFYPRAIDVVSAVRIRLQPGQDLTGLDIELQTALDTTVSGRVTSLLPVSDFRVPGSGVATLTLLPQSGNTLSDARPRIRTMAVSLTNPNDGAFLMEGVPPGEYDLFASTPNPSNPQRPAYGRSSVVVRDRNVQGVAIAIHPPADLKGKLLADGKSVTGKHLSLALEPLDSVAKIPGLNQIRTGIELDGSFTFSAVPESVYRLQAGTRAGQPSGAVLRRGPTPTEAPDTEFLGRDTYLVDVRQGGVSVLDRGIRVGAGYAEPLEVLVSSGGGTVQGTVHDSNRQTVPAATVVLMPPFERRSNPGLILAVSSSASGDFTISAVPPGEYKLFAWAEVPPGAYLDAEYMLQYENRGISVSVTPNENVSQQVSVIR